MHILSNLTISYLSASGLTWLPSPNLAFCVCLALDPLSCCLLKLKGKPSLLDLYIPNPILASRNVRTNFPSFPRKPFLRAYIWKPTCFVKISEQLVYPLYSVVLFWKLEYVSFPLCLNILICKVGVRIAYRAPMWLMHSACVDTCWELVAVRLVIGLLRAEEVTVS